MEKKLGIIAGGLDLPKLVVEHCRKTNRPFFVLAVEGQTDPETVINTDHAWVALGQVSKAIEVLKAADVKEVVMVGPVRRPAWHEIRPDLKGAKWLTRLATGAFGDDSLLRLIIMEIENEGFKVVGSEDLIGDELFIPAGIQGKVQPDKQALRDLNYGMSVAKAMGQVDVGQSIILQDGQVLGVEAAEGTSELIRRCKLLHKDGRGGILVKIAKPIQDRRVDLPTIGPNTIKLAHENGLQGIALQADAVQVLHFQEVIKLADQYGLFIIGIDERDSLQF